MIRLVFLVTIFFQNTLLTAQYSQFPTDTARWTYIRYADGSNNSFPGDTYHYLQQGDTVVGGKAYKKVYKDTVITISNNSPLHAFLRQDSNKVFVRYPFSYYNDTTEYILYNFNLLAGDTFGYKSMYDGSWNTLQVAFILNYVNIGNIFGSYEYLFDRLNPSNDWGPWCEGNRTRWGTRAGMDYDLFYNEEPWNFCDQAGNDQFIYCLLTTDTAVLTGTCDFHTSINDLFGPEKIITKDNGDLIEISWPSLWIGHTKTCLYDISGKKLITKAGNDNVFSINKSDYTAGIYCFTITTTNGCFVKKLLIHK